MALCLVTIFVLVFGIDIDSTSSSTIQSIVNVADIQYNIWCYLKWEERLLLRQVSMPSHQMHRHLFLSECVTITQCMDLSVCIHTIDPKELMSFFTSEQHFRFLETARLNQRSMEFHDLMFIEKIVADFTERALSLEDAYRPCTLWLKSCTTRFPGFDGNVLPTYHFWPIVDGNGSVVSCQKNLDKLNRMLRIAKNEMDRTKSKYNRYTRFAFVFLDAFLKSLETSVTDTVRYLWSNIASVDFISDYLLRPLLRDFEGPSLTAIELIMFDAVRIDGTLNTDRLSLMVDHPRILFNFDPIFLKLTEYNIWTDNTRIECLNYIVVHGLMTWTEMKDHLDGYRAIYMIWHYNPITEWMWHYVCARHFHGQLPVIHISNDPLFRKDLGRNHTIEARMAPRKRDSCCLCM